MKKSYITIKDEEEAPYDILGKQIEVFYLEQPDNPDPKFDTSLPTLADLCFSGNPPIDPKTFDCGVDDSPVPPIIVDDAGVNIETGKYVGGGIEEPSDDYYDPLMGNELDVNENSAGAGAPYFYHKPQQHSCHAGPKGETGPRGIDEKRMYPLILESLRKFSECQVDLSKDSACEVLADGIAKKITKYMWPSEEE